MQNRPNQTAIVTGSSGGIGSGVAKKLCSEGFQVLGLDQKPASFRDPNFLHVQVDLSIELEIIEALGQRQGGVSVVVHCAAEQPLIEVGRKDSRDKWSKALAVNLLALETICANVIEDLKQAKEPRIISIGSVHDRATSERMAPYSVSKSALSGWVRSASVDLARFKIPVTGISAGAVNSPKLAEGLSRYPDPTEARRNLVSRLPSGELIEVEQIAELVATLLGPLGRSFTGANLQFDGGVTNLLASE